MSDYIIRTCTDGDTIPNTFLKDKTTIELKNDQSVERTDGWKEKALHDQYIRKVEDMKTYSWKWETEGLLLAAQNQALPTRNYKIA